MRRIPSREKGIDIFPIDIVRGDEAPPIFAECDPQRRVFHLGKIIAETKVIDRDQLHANNGRMNAMMAIKEVAII
jgi:hypothetical protein